MRPPKALLCLMDFWGLSQREQKALWSAVARARWSVAVEWRQQLQLFQSPDPASVRHLVHEVCAPAAVLRVIEALTQEGLLPHRLRATLEEHILHAVDRDGHWCDHTVPVHRYARDDHPMSLR